MKVISINLGNAGSTGGIARNIKRYAGEKGIEVYTAYPDSASTLPLEDHDILIGKDFFRKVSRKLAVFTGLNGCFAPFATLRLIHRMKKIRPDVLHLHNLHHSYINLPMLFRYIRRSGVKVIWTLHDCWAFTGQCPHFTMVKCDKWKTGCHNCPQIHIYPEAAVDQTRLMWKRKRRWFTGIDNLHFVTPSRWLANLVRQSYLKDYDVQVIHNGIDLTIFRPMPGNFRETHHYDDKHLILGVAFFWEKRKGYDIFLRLADDLSDDYQIVLVGDAGSLPRHDKIHYINRTHDQNEMVQLYSCADLLANPTREDTFPTVNIEALACGTPVLTFQTGGSPEIPDSSCGSVVDCDDYEAFKAEIIRICTQKPYRREDCIKRAGEFTVSGMLEKYIELYQSV